MTESTPEAEKVRSAKMTATAARATGQVYSRRQE
jgi:hypothetical protein